MKHKFQFDKKSGTMVSESDAVAQGINANIHNEVQQLKPDSQIQKPVFQEEKRIDVKADAVNVKRDQIVRMQRVDKPTPIQLVDDSGVPEAYLDSITSGVMMFRELQDYDICQITDEKTGKVLAYIGGYALQINFNMAELKTMERIEQCLQGMVKLFRHKIMTQTLDNRGAVD